MHKSILDQMYFLYCVLHNIIFALLVLQIAVCLTKRKTYFTGLFPQAFLLEGEGAKPAWLVVRNTGRHRPLVGGEESARRSTITHLLFFNCSDGNRQHDETPWVDHL